MSASSGLVFIMVPDHDNDMNECDVWSQDCPDGEKCVLYAADGGSYWNALKCVPVMEDPAQVGEACFVVGGAASGIDNCVLGAMCWDPDEANQGTCVAMCAGSAEAPTCEPGFHCKITAEGVINLCERLCDPLAMDCDVGEVCIGDSPGGAFLCVLDASGEAGQVHDACEFANACDPGLLCANSTAAVECEQMASGCCEPFCDVTTVNTCQGLGQVCNLYYEQGMAPAGYEKLGFCAVPM